jgi:hypothetical protein
VPPMRGCDAACPQAPASAAAVWAGRPLMRRLRIRRNRRTRARSPTTEVASTDGRHTIFPVSCRHSRTPIIRHGRPAKDNADLSSLRSAHEARQATALARPQTPRGPPVSVHRLRACRHGRVAPSRRANNRGWSLGGNMGRYCKSTIPRCHQWIEADALRRCADCIRCGKGAVTWNKIQRGSRRPGLLTGDAKVSITVRHPRISAVLI